MAHRFHGLGQNSSRLALALTALITASASGVAQAATVLLAPFTLNSMPLDSQQQSHSLAPLNDGQFVAYWDAPSSLPSPDGSPRYDAVGRIFAIPNGQGQTDEFVSARLLANYGNDIDVVPSPGGYVLGWSEYENLTYGDNYVRRFSLDAQPASVRFPISDKPYQSEHYPRSSVLPASGEYLTVSRGYENGDAELYIRKFDTQSLPLTPSLRLTAGDGAFDSRPRIACNIYSSCALAWHSDPSGSSTGLYSVWVQLFNGATFTPIGAPMKVAGDGTVSDAFPTIGIADSGDFVVAWQRSTESNSLGTLGCYFRRYKANGKPQGGVKAITNSLCAYPDLVVAPNSKFAIANMEQPEGKTNQRIVVREYNADGSRSAVTAVAKRELGAGGLGSATIAIDSSLHAAVAWLVPASATAGDYEHTLRAAILQLGSTTTAKTSGDDDEVLSTRLTPSRLPAHHPQRISPP